MSSGVGKHRGNFKRDDSIKTARGLDNGRRLDGAANTVAGPSTGKSILDPNFKYVSSAHTDVAATFRRIRRQMADMDSAPVGNVEPIKKVVSK